MKKEKKCCWMKCLKLKLKNHLIDIFSLNNIMGMLDNSNNNTKTFYHRQKDRNRINFFRNNCPNRNKKKCQMFDKFQQILTKLQIETYHLDNKVDKVNYQSNSKFKKRKKLLNKSNLINLLNKLITKRNNKKLPFRKKRQQRQI